MEDGQDLDGAIFVRFAAGAVLTDLGKLRDDDGDEGGGALAFEVTSGMKVLSAVENGLVLVDLNLPS